MKRRRELSVPERHQLRIALDTLKMNDVMARVMGGPSKEEAREIVKRLTGRTPKKNPALHSVKVIGSNMTEADHGSVYILYSYETPVAIRPREGVDSKPLVTSYKHSVTTSKHIGKWLAAHGYTIKDAVRLSQDEIETIAKRGYYTKAPRENPRRRTGYRVHIGYTANGRDRWKYFPTLDAARAAVNEVHRRTGIVLTIQEVPKKNAPRRRTGRTLKRKKIASSHLRQRYEFFRKASHGGIEKPAASAKHAKELADAERWAYDNDVKYAYYYGRDADEESENEWDGRIVAEHPDGTQADAYGYLGDDWNQAHVKAEAALALMHEYKRWRKKNPAKRGGRGKFVHVRKVAPGKFVKQSFRTVKTNGKRVIVGHLKGETRRTKGGRRALTVQAVLRPKRGGRTVRRKNPLIGVMANPPRGDGKYLGKVSYIEYTHGHDGKPYYHHFKPAVYAQVMSDGSVVLWHPTNNLWKMFPEPE